MHAFLCPRKTLLAFAVAAAMLFGVRASARAEETLWLHTLDLSKMKQGFGTPQVNQNILNKPITLAGKVYEKGVGTHAASELLLELDGAVERFQAVIGIDDTARGAGSAIFRVIADNKTLFESGPMSRGDKPKTVDVDLKGVKSLILAVDPNGQITFDNADWADAKFIVAGAPPKPIDVPEEEAVILTPKPGPEPRVNGPTIYGCRPGHPFIYRIPAQGKRPMEFSAEGLPSTLKLDAALGIITGAAPERGTHAVTLRAKNGLGQSERKFRIVSGDTLALTPPMGWNDWYAHTRGITDKLMRQAADVMIDSGMADAGYQYVNIDDCWEKTTNENKRETDPERIGPGRDAKGNVVPNGHFPDMKGMVDYIHGKGLKAGLYSSPGPLTCAGYEGSYQHEEQDAKQYADWGFDFLKHDWCSYSKVAQIDPKDKSKTQLDKRKAPYKLMGDILKRQDRDIVLNLCQYGAGDVWEWGAEVGGHCWRTAGDLGYSLSRIFEVALKNAEHGKWSKPGAWNDPDYIMIGYYNRGIGKEAKAGKFPLTPNEQYAYFSLWCMMASPLFYSGDMGRLEPLTVSVLTNPEVIEVDQDALGISADVTTISQTAFVMVKPLEDGSRAVGLFNRGRFDQNLEVDWKTLGVSGPQQVRDLWRQKDLGVMENKLSALVPHRGVVLVRMSIK